MKELKNHIDLPPLTEEEISARALEKYQLWRIEVDGKIIGPFETNDLKEYSKIYGHLFETAQVQNLVSEEWKFFFHRPEFQRRKPKLVPAQSLTTDAEFTVKIEDKIFGPFDIKELKDHVEKGNISLNSLISIDKGSNWIKLYEHHEFDRRNNQPTQRLPFKPEVEGLGNDESLTLLKNKPSQEKVETLSTLAHTSRKRKGSKEQTKEVSSAKYKIAASLALVLGVAISYKSMNSNDHDEFTLTASPVETKVREIDNSPREIISHKTFEEHEDSPSYQESKRTPASYKKNKRNKKNQLERENKNWRPTEALEIDDPNLKQEIIEDFEMEQFKESLYDEDMDEDVNEFIDEYAQELYDSEFYDTYPQDIKERVGKRRSRFLSSQDTDEYDDNPENIHYQDIDDF